MIILKITSFTESHEREFELQWIILKRGVLFNIPKEQKNVANFQMETKLKLEIAAGW